MKITLDDLKKCSTCRKYRLKTNFSKNKASKDGLCYGCKYCMRLLDKKYRDKYKEELKEKSRNYYAKNRAAIGEARKKYRDENPEVSKRYRDKHKEELKEKSRHYYAKNRDAIKEIHKKYREENPEVGEKYREDNREKAKKESRGWSKKLCVSDRTPDLPLTDQAEFVDGTLTVLCSHTDCSIRFHPTNLEVTNRLSSYSGRMGGESRFYCSDTCKGLCLIFRHNPRHVDPRSKLAVPNSEKVAARNCQTNHLKQLQCDSHGYTYCEKCGDIIDVELHHTQEVSKVGLDSINSALKIISLVIF